MISSVYKWISFQKPFLQPHSPEIISVYVCVLMYVCVHVHLNLCCQCLYVTRICKHLGPIQVVGF